MSVRSLCELSHPALHRRAQAVESFSDDVRAIAQDLIDTMYANDGIGLAAPQIGCALQLFVANPSQESGREVVVANPSLEDAEGQTTLMEGCLSVPDVWERVKRSARVRLRGWDVAGRPVAIDAKGLLAVVFQHEWDHLQGRLFIDRLSWLRRRWLFLRKSLRGC